MRFSRASITAVLLVLTASFAGLQSADLQVDEATVPTNSFAVVKYKLEKGDSIIWEVSPPPAKMVEFTADGYSQVHFNGTPAKYDVTAFLVNFNTKKFTRQKVAITIGKSPQPPPVDPVDPVVPPKDVPFSGVTGLHVLITYETGDLSKYPSDVLASIYSKDIRTYLDAKCPLGTDGKTKQWRMWDKNVDGYDDSKVFGDALKRANEKQTKLPWISIGTGKDGYEGPLTGVKDTLDLLKKYGG